MSSYLSQFNYQITGPENGRKWVFLHGLMGYALNWRRIIKDLEETERILVFDQRGHGKSWSPATGYASEDFADDLYIIAEELNWEKFILVGHSMGARNALQFASQFPEKVEKLIMEDIGPESNPAAIEFYKWLFSIIPTPFKNKLAAKEFFLNEFKILSKGKSPNPETLGSYLYSNIVELPDGTATWRFKPENMMEILKLGRVKDRWSEFKNLSMPTLVIRGERSNELPREIFDQMCSVNSNVSGVEIANAGHWVHSEQPEAFIKTIRQFTDLNR